MNDKTKRPPVAQADVVLQNNELRKVNYSITKQMSMRQFVVLLASLGMNAFLAYLAFMHFPQSEFIPTSNAASICKVAPVSEPSLDHRVVSDFAVEAAVSMYSYDHVNFRKQIIDTAEKYFTPDYRNEFLTVFGDSPNLKAVVDNFYVVSATTAGRPAQIIKVGRKGGAYFWRIQVPINVYYVSGRKRQEEKMLAEIEVIRTNPTRLNPKGIGVSGSNIRPLMN